MNNRKLIRELQLHQLELEVQNEALRRRITAEQELQTLNAQLAHRVTELTAALATANQALALLGGQVQVACAPGAGTTVTMTLPMLATEDST